MAAGKHPHDTHVVADQGAVFAFLADPATHGLNEPVKRIDTHGAAVFLAGKDVYKVKRAVRFDYMDFSTLARRQAACEAELAVNRDNAPEIYLGVVPITRTNGGLAIGGAGEVVEWAVHLRRFDEAATLDRVAEAGGLTPKLIADLVDAVLASHRRSPERAADATVKVLAGTVEELAVGFAETPDLFPPDRVRAFAAAAGAALERTRNLLLARGAAGWVRHCHGDLHLRNIALIDGRPVLFDALEFDPRLATADVLYDLAFLLMDLWERGRHEAANTVLNRYLWFGPADHIDGLAAMPLFLAVRSAIRATVEAAALALKGEGGGERPKAYFDLAETVLSPPPPRLVAIGGLSGSGKSTLAARLAPMIGGPPGAVHLRSDIERKRLAGVGETERLPAESYTKATSDEVYAVLRDRAARALAAGQGVIVDAVHQTGEERHAIADVAAAAGARFDGIWLDVPVAALVERVERRTGDASDADAAVVRLQAERDVGEVAWQRFDADVAVDDLLAKVRASLKQPG